MGMQGTEGGRNSHSPNSMTLFVGQVSANPSKAADFDMDLTLHAEPNTLESMEVQFTPKLEQQLLDLAAATGQSAGELVQNATVGYLGELSTIQKLIDSRYDEIKSGRVQLIDGVSFFETLRIRETELLNKRPK